jgi:hypothetical protein
MADFNSSDDDMLVVASQRAECSGSKPKPSGSKNSDQKQHGAPTFCLDTDRNYSDISDDEFDLNFNR